MERKCKRMDQIVQIDNGDSSRLLKIKPNKHKDDRANIALLFFLYTLQGIPLGLSAAIPMILQNRGINYKQQAEFSFVNWPFSLKLMWAPLVDSIYSSRIGRRKTWMVPSQYLLGVFMLLLSMHVNTWLGNDGNEPNIGILTMLFFSLNFLAATQDIAVDGWALTMLRKENVGHASTCNSVGQTAGFFLSYVLFMALESTDFCNYYLRSVPKKEGLVTLAGFLYFWGCVFLVITTLVAFFKKEEVSSSNDDPEHDLKTAYSSLLDILKLKPVQTLVLLLLTAKIGFSATDSVMALKLVEAGIPKERLGLIAVPLIPLQIALPLIIAKYTTDIDEDVLQKPFEILCQNHDFFLSDPNVRPSANCQKQYKNKFSNPMYNVKSPPTKSRTRAMREHLILQQAFQLDMNGNFSWEKCLRKPCLSRVQKLDWQCSNQSRNLKKFKPYVGCNEDCGTSRGDAEKFTSFNKKFPGQPRKLKTTSYKKDVDATRYKCSEETNNFPVARFNEHVAVNIIERFLCSSMNKLIFKRYKDKLLTLREENPLRLLKYLQRSDAAVFDARIGYQIIFRLSGPHFPPRIVYRICSNIPFVNLHQTMGVSPSYFSWTDYNWRPPANRSSTKIRMPPLLLDKKRTLPYTKKNSRLTWMKEYYKF